MIAWGGREGCVKVHSSGLGRCITSSSPIFANRESEDAAAKKMLRTVVKTATIESLSRPFKNQILAIKAPNHINTEFISRKESNRSASRKIKSLFKGSSSVTNNNDSMLSARLTPNDRPPALPNNALSHDNRQTLVPAWTLKAIKNACNHTALPYQMT
ncbi:hypothetical protein TWF694_004757 [Orbilia ellipsospora]|uniref:Uncharacterized protein n=1 Tax=Orbilia ellipsospora TaxID=2528407 RepID=A0AAV9WX70_9PEZI